MALHSIDRVPKVIAELPALQSGSMTVGGYMPRGHDSYARVMNPMHNGDGHSLAWRTFATERAEVDAATKWTDLLERDWGINPIVGTIEPAVTATLARLLRAHTSTPTQCFFLVWEGYSGMRDDLRDTSSITLFPDRRMLILTGDLGDGGEPFDGMDNGRSAQWWMPADGAWAVGNDLYGASVYVSGTEQLITTVLAADDLEAYRATASMPIIAEEFGS